MNHASDAGSSNRRLGSATRRARLVRLGALALGLVLFAGALSYMDMPRAGATIRRLGVALPVALLFSGLWHLARTWAWAWCFPRPRTVSFLRLARVRLAAEAFSYLTIRGIAGEPLKVVLLADIVDSRQATAAVALERLAYIVGTIVIVGAASLGALVWLPLSPAWFRVFRAFAIGAAVLTVLTTVVIAGRGTYLQHLMDWIDRIAGTALATGRVGRFLLAVERHILEMIRGNRSRLFVLATATAISFVTMVLEAWVVIRAAGAPLSVAGAFAVETFSRVASFASAFIPANIGALEATSVAAVAAVGATGAGTALAIARRIRGLFWAGIGLAIYPRGYRRQPGAGGSDANPPVAPKPTLLYLPHGRDVVVPPSARVAGMAIAERVIRSALRAGYGRVIVGDVNPRRASASSEAAIARLARPFGKLVVTATTPEDWRRAVSAIPASQCVTVVGAGTVVSPSLLAAARACVPPIGEVMDVAAGVNWPASGVIRIAASYAADLPRLSAVLVSHRARAAHLPSGAEVATGRAHLALRIRQPADLADAETTIRRSSYKETDSTLARFNRRMSLPLSVALIRTTLTPNQLSVVLVAMGLYSAWLFSVGSYWTGLLGAVLSLAASILDGCDGEIARLKYQESALGCWIETFGDYSYYIAIFGGLTIGAVHRTHWQGFYWLGAAALIGTLVSFALLIYLRSRITAGQPDRLHAIARDRFRAEPSPWSRVIWRMSFVATRAAMPYGIMAFALFNALPGIVVLAALGANIYWISLVLKLKDLLAGDEERTAAA
jgi:phosphatidylglycerophosphate synthase